MSDPDIPMSTPDEYSAYPDIDEDVRYPWQGHENQQPSIGDLDTSVIDPRLYGGDSNVGAEEELDQAQGYYPSDLSEDERDIPRHFGHFDAGDDDSDYVAQSGDDDEDEEDEEDEDDEDVDNNEGPSGRPSRGWGARGGKGIKRGPRKPLEPGPEFKMLHSEATEAFIDGDYDRAMNRVTQAIHMNPEMFPAHSLLSEIFLAKGEKDKALAALWNGAHTRPKDASVWLKIARLILQRAGDNRRAFLKDVVYCYNRVLGIEPKNYTVRYHRAAIYREYGYNVRAAKEYERILRDRPHNPKALRHLAEIYIDLNQVHTAIDRWEKSVDHFLSIDPEEVRFSWSEVNIYVELYSMVGRFDEGLHALGLLARWLLGRGDDTLWDDFDEDDREWDPSDSPRRIKTNGFVPEEWPLESYGIGLPLELRIKMGIFRLKMGYKYHDEALHHFEWLNPEDSSENARIFDYGDLFREVADALKDHGLPEEAYRFYHPIQNTSEYADIGYFIAMADCCMQLEKHDDAEGYYLTVAEHDSKNMESRVGLAKLYECLNMSDEAMKFANEAVLLGRQEGGKRRRKDTRLEQLADEFRQGDNTKSLRPLAPKPTAGFTFRDSSTLKHGDTGPSEESMRAENAQFLYGKLKQLEPFVKEGDSEATEDWLDIADALLRDFRSNKVFYPIARTMEFQGYSRKDQKGKNLTLLDEAQAMAGRLLSRASAGRSDEPISDSIPNEYYNIPFDEWLDIFLQYALIVADQGEVEDAYQALDSASVANIWIHSKSRSRLIHVCWFTCALRARDEEVLAHEARWFIKEYQFVTDTYRLFSMLSHISADPLKPFFHTSPNMKFMLRQIKAMDFTLPDEPAKPQPVRQSLYKERASLSTKDEFGERIPAESLDIALLILYGHILYSGGSFYPALNYFFRAYALDPENPACLLSIALSYIQHSFKRQSDNRHYLIMQGLSFLNEYRRVRIKPGTSLPERQEVEFNFARAWHGLGLAHLAVPAYEKVLEIGQEIQEQAIASAAPEDDTDVDMDGADESSRVIDQNQTSNRFVEDFTREAAYALQCIHVMGGDPKLAKDVTEKWLVI